MAIHKIELDDYFEEEQFSLIGIHCTIKDYRLAYLINKSLNTNFKRCQNDIEYSDKSKYSIFEWEDDMQQIQWHLVSNNCKLETELQPQKTNTLFNSNQKTTQTHYLVPEYKKVNFLLKICNQLNSNKERLILSKILSISQVVTAYSINVDQLKSKDYLIFN